jgi:hypothetical protein
MAALTLMAIVAAVLEARQAGWRLWLRQPWLLGIALGIVISGLGRVRVGGNLNNRMPAYALLCLAPALWARLGSGLPPLRLGRITWPALERVWNRWPQWGLAAAVLVQFGLGVYNPARYIPTAAMRQSGDRLIQRIAAIPGPVLVMMHPFYAQLAGKAPSTQIATLWYVRERGALPLPLDFVGRFQSHYYAAIISDQGPFETEPDLQGLLNSYYVQAAALGPNDAPPTMTGVVVRPQLVYAPRAP